MFRSWSHRPRRMALLGAFALVLVVTLAIGIPGASGGSCIDTYSSGCSQPPNGSWVVTITSPSSGSVTGTVPFSASVAACSACRAAIAPEPVDTGRMEFFVDDLLLGADSAAPYSISWNTLSAVMPAHDGTHRLRAVYSDGLAERALDVTVANTSGTKFRATFVAEGAVPLEMFDASAGVTYPVDVRVTNTSNDNWLSSATTLRYRWIGPDGVTTEGATVTNLGTNLNAGASRSFPGYRRAAGVGGGDGAGAVRTAVRHACVR
jgi:hypothetical protein